MVILGGVCPALYSEILAENTRKGRGMVLFLFFGTVRLFLDCFKWNQRPQFLAETKRFVSMDGPLNF